MNPLPDAISRYLEAANRFDSRTAAGCFTPDARVHDESADHLGHDAIEAWIADTSRKYRPQTNPLRCVTQPDGTLLLTVQVTGTFPSSPIELDLAFTLRDGLISQLVIQ